MKKLRNKVKGVVLGLGLAAMVAMPGFARESEIETERNGLSIQVWGYAHDPNNDNDYIGITFDTNGNGEFDIDDISLYPIAVDKGRFRESFDFFTARRVADGTAMDLLESDYVVAIWDRLVRDCGDEWCNKFGYHLEGRMDTAYGFAE